MLSHIPSQPIKTAINIVTIVTATYLGLLTIVFLISKLSPIDPVLAAIGDNATSASYEEQKYALGLHLPLYQQFANYLLKALQGDFGFSVLTSNPVLTDIKRVFPATIELATFAFLIGTTVGIPFGILAAKFQDHWPDHLLRIISLLGNSISIFWLALMGLLLFYAKLGWAPEPGRINVIYADFSTNSGFLLLESLFTGNWKVFIDALHHIILPATILGYYNLSHISRMTRTFMIEELNQEYITTARIKGLSEWRILFLHAFRNAAVPLVTILILSYGSLLEGSTFIETIFTWPGLGFYLTQSLCNADANAILGCTIVLGTIFISFNLLADYLYHKLDPRTKPC